MFKPFLLAGMLLLGQNPQPTGVIAGAVVAQQQRKVVQPVQVILLSSRYTNLWNSDVQKRLDVYWETYKPAFAVKKDSFLEASKQAHREATNYIVRRMRQDPNSNASTYMKETSAEGTFEFKNVPFDEYKILAIGKIGNEEMMWQESVDVRTSIPQFLELNKPIP